MRYDIFYFTLKIGYRIVGVYFARLNFYHELSTYLKAQISKIYCMSPYYFVGNKKKYWEIRQLVDS